MSLCLLLLLLLICGAAAQSANAFVTVWSVPTDKFLLKIPISAPVNPFTVYWGDDNRTGQVFAGFQDFPVVHNYTKSGNYTVSIDGYVYYFAPHTYSQSNSPVAPLLLEVKNWGQLVLDSKITSVFLGCSNMTVSASGQPLIWQGADLTEMFASCSQFNTALTWDITNVTKLTRMFYQTPSFNSLLTLTNTGQVTTTLQMFYYSAYNQPLVLNTSSVTTMGSMFQANANFNQPLHFDTKSCTDFESMFAAASSFNSLLNFSDTSKVTTMNSMFSGAYTYNQPVNFNTRAVQDMDEMFWNSQKFNQPLHFDCSSVTTMSYMLAGSNFSQPLNFINTSSVSDMSWMFYRTPFNHPVDSLNTQNVSNFDHMFDSALCFNQSISSFSFGKARTVNDMFYGTNAYLQDLSNVSFPATLIRCDDFCPYCYFPSFLVRTCSPCRNSPCCIKTGNGTNLCNSRSAQLNALDAKCGGGGSSQPSINPSTVASTQPSAQPNVQSPTVVSRGVHIDVSIGALSLFVGLLPLF